MHVTPSASRYLNTYKEVKSTAIGIRKLAFKRIFTWPWPHTIPFLPQSITYYHKGLTIRRNDTHLNHVEVKWPSAKVVIRDCRDAIGESEQHQFHTIWQYQQQDKWIHIKLFTGFHR